MSETAYGEVAIYEREDGAPGLAVRLGHETVWLSQQQLAELFDTSRTNVVEHIGNIYAEGELSEAATCRDFRQVRTEGTRTVERSIPRYNLDVIISVGYRVKSSVATRFRIWATDRLREFLLQGADLNHERLAQIGSIVTILSRSTDEVIAGVADVLSHYLPGLRTLRDYDQGHIEPAPGTAPHWTLNYEEARAVVDQIAAEFPEDALFGGERGGAFRGVVETIYQGFGSQDLYPTVQEKAANLLYLVVKGHPFSDGNKRSAAALFVHFLARNGSRNDRSGVPMIANNTLAAITLMVALLVRMITDSAA